MAKLPDSKVIKELADLLDESSLTEIEVETDGVRIRVARQGTVSSNVFAAPVPQAAPPAQMAPAAPSAVAAEPAPAAANQAGAVKSPMVGTAYLAPEPGTPDFVTVGSSVKKGQTLLIIEAMKTMNPILAPQAGTVTQIIVQNEQPVEFDEALLIIE
jgi:acetyl-CoA carboxylase biotin carboxyl carrier protein